MRQIAFLAHEMVYQRRILKACRGVFQSEAGSLATLEWVSWFNHQRLMGPLGQIPTAEADPDYCALLNRHISMAAFLIGGRDSRDRLPDIDFPVGGQPASIIVVARPPHRFA